MPTHMQICPPTLIFKLCKVQRKKHEEPTALHALRSKQMFRLCYMLNSLQGVVTLTSLTDIELGVG